MITRSAAALALLTVAVHFRVMGAEPEYPGWLFPLECNFLEVTDFDGDGWQDFATVANGRFWLVHGADDPWFETPIELASSGMAGFTLGDFDGDGDDDALSFLSPLVATVHLYENSGGTLVEAGTMPGPTLFGDVEAGDADGDGDDDLFFVTDVVGADNFHIYQWQLGTFVSLWSATLVTTPRSVETADLNGDGLDDAVVRGLDELTALVGDGTGTWTVGDVVSVASPFDLVIADVDGDGAQDLVVGSQADESVVIAYGDGSGAFPTQVSVPLTSCPAGVCAVDLDADGDLEIFVLEPDRSRVTKLTADPGPGFTLTSYPVDPAVRLAVSDINGDGALDLLMAASYLGTALGDGAGGLITRSEDESGETPDGRDLAPIDLNGDPFPDLAVADGESGEVDLFTGTGVEFIHAESIPVGGVPHALVVSDLDGNGAEDIAVADGLASEVSIVLDDGAGGWSAPVVLSVGAAPSSVVAADFDGDGDRDLAVTCAGSDELWLVTTVGAATFETAATVTGSDPRSLATGDFNADGAVDLALVNGFGVFVYYGFGDGSFSSPAAPWTGLVLQIEIADWDGDGDDDIIARRYGELVLLRSTGGLGFESEILDTALGGGGAFAVGDIDADGNLDVVIDEETWWKPDTLAVQHGEAGGTLTPPERYGRGGGGRAHVLVDTNADGWLDLVTLTPAISVLPYLGQGTAFIRGDAGADGVFDISDPVLVLDSLFVTGAALPCLDAADVNDDGMVDISDAITALSALFLPGSPPPPPPPYPLCGTDPTGDVMGCGGSGCP